MGTSNAFSGSGGKDTRDLQDAVSDWLTDLPSSAKPQVTQPGETPVGTPKFSPDKLKPALRILGSRVSGGGRSKSTTGKRTYGGPNRSVSRTSRSAGRAAAAANAYLTGDRVGLARLGLDYDELARMDRLDAIARIVDLAVETPSSGSIEDHEERLIAGAIAEWVSRFPPETPPTGEQMARKTIGLMIAEIVLTEVGDTIRRKGGSSEDRIRTEKEIREVAEVIASQAQLGQRGVTALDIESAVNDGVQQLCRDYEVVK